MNKYVGVDHFSCVDDNSEPLVKYIRRTYSYIDNHFHDGATVYIGRADVTYTHVLNCWQCLMATVPLDLTDQYRAAYERLAAWHYGRTEEAA